MEEEIKKAYMDWSEKGVSYLNCMCVYDIMMDVDEALQTCDTILDEIDLGIDYTSREKDIDRLLEGHGTLHRYIDVLNCYVDDKLDQPLKKDFKKNATETISRIHLEDFEVDNTLGLTENNYITGGMGYAGTMVEQEKAKLTFADFIGTSDGKADGNGLHMAYTNGSVEDFASIFAAQYEAMKASGALGEDNNLTQQEFLEQFYRQGEFTHDSSNPFLNFVSSVLDITIIKPVIESCIGEDLITGEDLTDMERGLKVVFAMVDLVTLGGAIAATKFSEMGLKEGLKAFGKTALIDFAGNTAACGVGALGETFDWPVPITMMLSLAAGITVSISGNKLLFKNADGVEIGAKTLSEREWESFRDLMSPEEAARYDKYWSLKETTCTSDELYIYLKNIDTDYAETFLKTGEWPDEIQIPKNASVLNKDGSINWTKAAAGGYKLDKDGNPIKEKFIPKIGEVIDRYGPANGRYTSPIIDGKSFEYTERSLPYVENLSNYHKYKVIGDFSKIEEYVKNCPDAKLKAQVEAIVKKYYKGDYSRLASYKGEAAAVEGWGKGGAIQYELSLTVEQLERLGLLREIN